MNYERSTESNDSLRHQLRKLSQELSGNKIELRHTSRYLQCILQNSNDLIFATDVDGILVSFSKGGERVLGYPGDEVTGSSVKVLASNSDAFESLLAESREKGGATRLEFPFRHRDGRIIYCDVSLITLTNTEGENVGSVGVCRDITLWKRLQEDLIRIDRLAEIGRIASGIAHEINNPLAVVNEISGWGGTVVADAKGLSDEDRRELEKAFKNISEQTRRCRAITHQLLGFVRDSAPSMSSLDIHELIRETINLLQPELKFMALDISLNLTEDPITVRSDAKMLEQVLVNLMTNAVHAVTEGRPDKGRIEVTTMRVGHEIRIVISDNGKGIPEEDQGKVFELFYSTKPPGKGTGLGLPICQNILKKLGGEITLESRPGAGTAFTVRLPVS
jgi:two-component system NtrC family sensor kinase